VKGSLQGESAVYKNQERKNMKTRLAVVVICLSALTSVVAQTAKSEFFKTSDGIRIHYLDSGDGRPIVFIPGWTMPAWAEANR
jgi:hypothetical protein